MYAERNDNRNVTYTDLQNPLFIRPSDGPNSLLVGEKLAGSSNYRTWKRAMELWWSTKRKLGFIQGTLPKPTDDPVKMEQWEACNSLVIAWLINSVSDAISRSVLNILSATLDST